MTNSEIENFEAAAAGALAVAARQLEETLAELAGRLRPFPAFMGMVSVQAVELEPNFSPARDLGCVVVDPAGKICRLEITSVDGIAGLTETDQIEEFQVLDLTDLEYILYAATAIELLAAELRSRIR